MIDVAELQSKLDALQRSRYAGTRRIVYLANGVSREIEYKSDQEMARAIAALETQIAEVQGTPKSKNLVVRAIKGW
jgi:hypothetical protein